MCINYSILIKIEFYYLKRKIKHIKSYHMINKDHLLEK